MFALGVAVFGVQTHAATQANTALFDEEIAPVSFDTCIAITVDSERLACFDAVAAAQSAPKRQLAVASTLKNTMTGKPKVVFEEEESQGSATKMLVDINKPKEVVGKRSVLSVAYDLDKNSEDGLWTARPHNANYILPLYINAKPNRHPHTPTQDTEYFTPNQMRVPELKFQLSLKTKAAENLFDTDADLWVGYTQMSHWQVYNEDNSRPFRAHDYEPEIFVTQPVAANLPFNGRLRMLGAGAVHHSNGESDPLSRSWNRAYIMGGAEWERLTIVPRIWGRVLKKEDSAKPDDNPDILDYYGYGDVKFLYQLGNNSNVSGLVRLNPKTGKGALQLDYTKPIGNGIIGYVQLFHGYGQSLIDYNHEATSIGVGVMLNDWLGL